ncbi:MAG: DAK2 domain-containing protein, partial [Elusimicrobiota bacterium]
RDGVEAAYKTAKTEADIMIMFETMLIETRRALMDTPNQLPVLKEAGVVDAGAMGFVFILEGIHMLLEGRELPVISTDENKSISVFEPVTEVCYGYCLEFMLCSRLIRYENIIEQLKTRGESLVTAQSENMMKIHIHSMHPGNIIEDCLEYGTLTDIKIENMDKQHYEAGIAKTKKETVIVAVGIGRGITKIFESLGCDSVIQGGQTMNPSVEELDAALKKFDAENYIILPNNSNIIFTAEQLNELNKGKNIFVVPTKSVPEGFSAMIAYDKNAPVEENLNNIGLSIRTVKTGEVTRAVKDYSAGTAQVKKGDIITIYREKISMSPDTHTAVVELVSSMYEDEDEIISLFYGEDTPEDEARRLGKELEDIYRETHIEVHHGGQPHYYYIVSIE